MTKWPRMRENILVRQNGEIKVRMWKVPIPEETHHYGKYHHTADLLFDWFGFVQTIKVVVHST